VEEQAPDTVAGQDPGHLLGEDLGRETAVVTDHGELVRTLGREVLGDALGRVAQGLVGEVVADHAAPAVGAELDLRRRPHCAQRYLSFFSRPKASTTRLTSWALDLGHTSSASGVSTITKSRRPMAATSLPGAEMKQDSVSMRTCSPSTTFPWASWRKRSASSVQDPTSKIGRASCRERVYSSVGAE